jgi:hypothetical protein
VEVLYISGTADVVDDCPYIYTESAIIKNAASICDIWDFVDYLARGQAIAYYKEADVDPVIDFLNRTGIEYRIEIKPSSWF